jgi:hypothetical protein
MWQRLKRHLVLNNQQNKRKIYPAFGGIFYFRLSFLFHLIFIFNYGRIDKPLENPVGKMRVRQ